MKLRDHPLMTYRGVRIWPPLWIETRPRTYATVTGEIGTLTYVYSTPAAMNRCTLVIEHDTKSYVGTLIFSDEAFCKQVCELLRRKRNRTIKEIGDLDVNHTF
jgi:hypothetical protein